MRTRRQEVAVLATNLDTGAKDAASSGAAGDYVFRWLPPGRYSIEVRQPGFAVQRQDVVLAGSSPLRLDATLQLGQVTETVDVIGQRPQPETAAPGTTPRRIRVGGNVQATRLVTMAKPVYPPQALAEGVQGSVILRAMIGISGNLLSLEPVNTRANPELTAAALNAVRQWRYQPTLLNGQPVEVVTAITVNFHLAP